MIKVAKKFDFIQTIIKKFREFTRQKASIKL